MAAAGAFSAVLPFYFTILLALLVFTRVPFYIATFSVHFMAALREVCVLAGVNASLRGSAFVQLCIWPTKGCHNSKYLLFSIKVLD
jgi:hypothetical protein